MVANAQAAPLPPAPCLHSLVMVGLIHFTSGELGGIIVVHGSSFSLF